MEKSAKYLVEDGEKVFSEVKTMNHGSGRQDSLSWRNWLGEKRTERVSQDEDATPTYKYRRTDDLPMSHETEAEISPEPETVPGVESTKPESDTGTMR